jgi:hypothetical protein
MNERASQGTMLQRLRKPRIVARVALAVITGFASGVGQAVAKSVLPQGRVDDIRARLEERLHDTEADGDPAAIPTAEDHRQALDSAPLEHLQAVAADRGLAYDRLDHRSLVDVIVASERSERLGRRLRSHAEVLNRRAREQVQPKRKADLQRQQRQLGKRKVR